MVTNRFLKQIVPLLHDKEISPDQLGLEVTEGVHWTEQNITPLLSLKAAGIFFSLDDFGKGVSGYNAIKTFPFDKVKIDRKYVKNLKDSAIDRAIVSSIMHLANQLNIEVIAEGVEDKQTVVILNELGCHSVQGYLYTKALPNDQLLKYLLTQGGSYEKANYNWSNC